MPASIAGAMNLPDEQGCITTGCPYCRVLHAQPEHCSRCNGRSSFQAAQMIDENSIHKAVTNAVDAFDGTRAQLDALLQVLFVYRPASLTAFAKDGRYSIEQLRDADHALASKGM